MLLFGYVTSSLGFFFQEWEVLEIHFGLTVFHRESSKVLFFVFPPRAPAQHLPLLSVVVVVV